MATVYATCHTAGCDNAGVQIPLVDPEDLIICGPCGVQITALADEPVKLPTEVPDEWL